MSFIADLAAIREKISGDARQELPVPGTGEKIVVRFRPPPAADPEARERLTAVVAAYRMQGALSAEQELQLLIDCCDEVLHRNGDGQLHQPDDAGPLRFDASDDRWGDDVETARDCVRKLYSLDVQPLAASGTADNLVDWLQGLHREVLARVEGKSESGAR